MNGNGRVLEVRWLRADLPPGEVERRLKAAFRLILDAQREASGSPCLAADDPEAQRAELQGPARPHHTLLAAECQVHGATPRRDHGSAGLPSSPGGEAHELAGRDPVTP